MTSRPDTIDGDLWCITFGRRSLGSRLREQVVDLGLAAALLAELLLSGHVELTAAGSMITRDIEPPTEWATRSIHQELRRHADEQDVVTWLKYLARTSYDDVARRLIVEGIVRPRGCTRLPVLWTLGQDSARPVRYTVLDPERLREPSLRVAPLVTGRQSGPASLGDLACAGLAIATGLVDTLLADPRDHARAEHSLPELITHLPPTLASLLTRTESAVGDALLTNRDLTLVSPPATVLRLVATLTRPSTPHHRK